MSERGASLQCRMGRDTLSYDGLMLLVARRKRSNNALAIKQNSTAPLGFTRLGEVLP